MKVTRRIEAEAENTLLVVETHHMPDGSTEEVPIVLRPAAVGVVAMRLDEQGRPQVLVIRQNRRAVREPELVEIVAGKVEDGENPFETAARELWEEAGLRAGRWIRLGAHLHPSPGFLVEPIHLYVATELTSVPRRAEDAHIILEWVPFEEARRMVREGEIRDMKAMLALLLIVEQDVISAIRP